MTLVMGVFTGLLGLIVLYGWYAHKPILVQFYPAYIAMVYNTALCFLLSCLALLMILYNRFFYLVVTVLAAILLLGILALLQHLTGKDFHIDQLFFQHDIITKTIHPGRMALNTVAGFILSSMALLIITIRLPRKYYVIPGGFLGLMILVASVVFLSGYLFDIPTVYEWGKFTPMAPNTAIGFMLLGLGIIALVWQRSLIERIDIIKILPALVFLCFLVGTFLYWQALKSQRYHVFQTPYILNVTLIFGVLVACLIGLILHFVIVAERKAHSARKEAEKNKASLSLVNATLESTADGILVVNTEGKVVSFNQKFLQLWSIPQSLMEFHDDRKLLNFVLGQLQNPKGFIQKVKELYAHPEAEGVDEIRFKDGKIFERYSKPQRIEQQVVGRVWSYRDVTKHRRAEEQIIHQATHDLITNLPNRPLLIDRLSQAIILAEHERNLIAVLFLDIDRFIAINDSLGYKIGDLLLKKIAARLTKHIRKNDTFARFGGDEFVIILTALKQEADCAPLIEKYMHILSRKYMLEGHEFNITWSMGISFYPRDGREANILLKNAEAVIHSAQLKSGNNFQFYTEEINAHIAERLTLENDLRNALKRNEFLLHYQPIFHLQTGHISGVEALIRWNHPQQGLIFPQKFILLAEETGLINSIGEWVLKTACLQRKKWQNSGISLIRIAINLSGEQFKQPKLEEQIYQIMKETQIDPHYLEIEITESIIMEDSNETIGKLRALANLGINLSIDDFGTGYSSLSYLKRFPLHTLKIDQSFIRDIDTDRDDMIIVKAIINMTKSLQLKVLAEGIETESQLQFLKQQQCDEGQGYYLSKPLDADAIVKFFQENTIYSK